MLRMQGFCPTISVVLVYAANTDNIGNYRGRQYPVESNTTSTGFRAIEIVPYNFTSGEGKTQSTEIHLDWLSIGVRLDVAQNNSTLEVHLPVELLKQLEIDGDFKYCAGNGFGVSADNQNVESNMVNQTDKERVLTIPLESSSKMIEISGISFLMSPPTCD